MKLSIPDKIQHIDFLIIYLLGVLVGICIKWFIPEDVCITAIQVSAVLLLCLVIYKYIKWVPQ